MSLPSRPLRSIRWRGGLVSSASRTAGSVEETIAVSAPAQRLAGLVGEQPPQVGQFRLDLAAVGADQAGRVDDRVVDADVEPLADQPLGEFHVRALPQVIGVHLEAEAEQGDGAGVGRGDAVHHFADHQLVAGQRAGQQGQVGAVHAGQVQQRPEVFGQAGSAEGEAGAQVGR